VVHYGHTVAEVSDVDTAAKASVVEVAAEPAETEVAAESSERGAPEESLSAEIVVEPTPEAAGPKRKSLFRKVARKDDMSAESPVAPDEPADTVVGPVAVSEPVGATQAAEPLAPEGPELPEWPAWPDTVAEASEVDEVIESPKADSVTEPTLESAKPGRGSKLRKLVRKRGLSLAPAAAQVEEPLAVLDDHVGAQPDAAFDADKTVLEPAVEPAPEPAAEPGLEPAAEQRRGSKLRKLGRKRGLSDGISLTPPVAPAEGTVGAPAEESPGMPLTEAPLPDVPVEPQAPPVEQLPAEAPPAVLAGPAPELGPDASPVPVPEPALEIAEALAPALEVEAGPDSVPEPAEPVVEPLGTPEPIVAPESPEPKRGSVLRKLVRKRDSAGMAAAIPDETADLLPDEALEPMAPFYETAEAYEEAPRRSRPIREWLAIAGIVIGFLALAVGVPVWLVWYGGLSLFSGDETTVTTIARTTTSTGISSPSANARVVDIIDDPRGDYIVDVVRAGIVQLVPNEANEVSFLPGKAVRRGELLVWLDRVQRIPAGSGDVPDTFYYDLDASLREKAIHAYQSRIVLAWPDEDTKIAFNAADPILARDAEAWAARMIIRLLPTGAVQRELETTEKEARDLRARISALKPEELARIVEGFEIRPEAGWAEKESISRSEAAEFLMRLKAVFDKHL